MTEEKKEYEFEILDIVYINGKKAPIDYGYRKTIFETEEELINYKRYLSNKLKRKLYFTIKDLNKKSKRTNYKHLKVFYKEPEEDK